MIRIIIKLQNGNSSIVPVAFNTISLILLYLYYFCTAVCFICFIITKGKREPRVSVLRGTTGLLISLPAMLFTRDNAGFILSVPLQIKSPSPSFQNQVPARSQPDLHKEGGVWVPGHLRSVRVRVTDSWKMACGVKVT